MSGQRSNSETTKLGHTVELKISELDAVGGGSLNLAQFIGAFPLPPTNLELWYQVNGRKR
jgi:hypothetical protein